jgi:hypothetical protein
MKPIVHGLEARYGDRIQFTYLDIDDARTDGIKAALGYRVQPDYFLLDGSGHIVKRWLGDVAEQEFASAFESALK